MEKDILQTKIFGIIILSITGLVILVFVFGLGIVVGTKRADFSFQWAEAYHKNFGGPAGGFFGNMMGDSFTNANGVFGQIIKIDGQSLTIKGGDGTEKIVIADDDVTIKFQTKNEKISDLKIGDNIVAIGEPNANGQIDAQLIRVMPSLPAAISSPIKNN
jgi:hypothetical protein